MKYVVLVLTASALAGCADSAPSSRTGIPTAPGSPSFLTERQPLESFAGAYTLTIDVDAACSRVPDNGKVRQYDVALIDHQGSYLTVRTNTTNLVGDLWARGLFRWNGDESDTNCGTSETLGSAAYCLWGQGIASQTADGALSGRLTGGVDVGEDKCYGTHRFSLRRKD